MEKKPFYRLSCILGTLLCIVLITVVGCTPCINGYKQLTVDKGIARFSFEYPCKWELSVLEIRPDYTHFSVHAPRLKRDNADISSTSWTFLALPASNKEWPNAVAAIEDSLSFWEDELDFEVLERSKIEIDQITAEQVIYCYRYRLVDPATMMFTEESEPVTIRDIYFDYDGLVWHIGGRSNLEVAEVHKVHFEHLLNTFRILK